MILFRPQTLVLALLLFLFACASPMGAPAGASYFWLPVLGIAGKDAPEARVREAVETMLSTSGYTRQGAPVLALAIATDAPRDDDGSLGSGPYAGGYAYFTPARAPAGFIEVTAYDARTLKPVWRARVPRDVAVSGDDQQLQRSLADSMLIRTATL